MAIHFCESTIRVVALGTARARVSPERGLTNHNGIAARPVSLQPPASYATFKDDSRYALRAQVPAGLNRKEAEIYSRLDPERLPHHIAIIMDGNGRWAKRRHLPRIAGHRSGVAAVRSTVETAARLNLPALTLYSFSAENWKRPKGEVQFLMNLLRRYLKMELPTLMENNIRLQYIGRQHELPQEVQERMAWAREMTERNTGMVLTLALNYGSRTELVDCFNALVNEAVAQRRHRAHEDRRALDRASSLYEQPARARPRHPHQRRDAPQQLPAVAGRLR